MNHEVEIIIFIDSVFYGGHWRLFILLIYKYATIVSFEPFFTRGQHIGGTLNKTYP